MSSETDLGSGISIKACRSDLGLEYPVYLTKLGRQHSFELDESRVMLPVDIIGFNAKPDSWIVLELLEAPEFLIVSSGDMLAVRRTNKARSGQIVIIKHEERVLIKQIFISGSGLVLRSFNQMSDLLVLPSAVSIRGTIEGLAIEKCWYKLVTSEKLPDR